eukprot:scaffold58355_cov66-Phaeocystis_antarctica.AAC.1
MLPGYHPYRRRGTRRTSAPWPLESRGGRRGRRTLPLGVGLGLGAGLGLGRGLALGLGLTLTLTLNPNLALTLTRRTLPPGRARARSRTERVWQPSSRRWRLTSRRSWTL